MISGFVSRDRTSLMMRDRSVLVNVSAMRPHDTRSEFGSGWDIRQNGGQRRSPMTEQEIRELKKDFRTWSGGCSPESDYQITVYVDYASNVNWDDEEVREALRDWMESDDPDEDIYAFPQAKPSD
jgi:hypothetical protein